MVLIESFTHDADGNMTTRTNEITDDTITFAWDDFDKLMKVSSADLSGPTNTAKVDNRFDVNGIRKRKLGKAGNASAEYTTDITTLASDALGTSTLPTISYIQGHLLLGYEEDGDFRYFLTDALGAVRDIVDDTGTVIKSYEFDEYGNLLSSSGSGTTSPKTWIGGLSVNDDTADSGLYLMGYRHYAGGTLGRFINRDPIGHAGSSFNLYAYPANPVKYSDPSGLRLFLFGSKTAVSNFEYLIEEATGYDINFNQHHEVSINSYRGGGSESARRILKDVIDQDSCTKIRASSQERGRFNPNFGLFKNEKYGVDLHEIYLRPHRLLKERVGAAYAYGSLFHEIAEAGHAARTGDGYGPSHAVGNLAQASVLGDFGILAIGADTNLFMEKGQVFRINRKGGFNKGSSHVHIKDITKTCVFPQE